MSNRAEIFNPGFLEVGQVAAVMDNAHSVGFGEPNSQGMGEAVVTWIQR
jgi:hypothetical protein